MLKIRLQRVGRKHEPTFRVVLTDSKNSTKSGKIHEILGSYDPRKKTEILDGERIKQWMSKGAQATGTMHNLLITHKIIEGKKKNVLPHKKPWKSEAKLAEEKAAADAIVAKEAADKAEAEAAVAKEAQDKADAEAAAAAPAEETPVAEVAPEPTPEPEVAPEPEAPVETPVEPETPEPAPEAPAEPAPEVSSETPEATV